MWYTFFMNMSIDDKQLVEQSKTDKEAFSHIYNQYHNNIYNFFFYRFFNAEIAEDLMQETFLRAFSKLDAFEYGKATYKTYLYTIAHNLFVNHIKDGDNSLYELKEIAEDVKQHVNNDMDIFFMWKEIEKLSIMEKDIFLLRYRKDMSVKEIAQITGKTENAVKLVLSKGRKKIKISVLEKDLPKLQGIAWRQELA